MEHPQPTEKPTKRQTSKNKQSSQYLKYSGIVFQMLGIIGAGAFMGVKLDQWQQMERPIFTAIFSLVFVFIALYFSLKDFVIKK